MKDFYIGTVNASGGWQRTYGVHAESPEQALELMKNGNSTHFYDDLLEADCQYEDSMSIDDIELGDEIRMADTQKEAPQAAWDTLRKFKDKWYCPKAIRNAINQIAYI